MFRYVPCKLKLYMLLINILQMPIRDGYSATHAIRTEAPWRDKPDVRGVPIVAMTASAIQGDKEKCTLAGMDVSLHGTLPYIEELVTNAVQDYLAKPVKGKLLEKVRFSNPRVDVRLTRARCLSSGRSRDGEKRPMRGQP